MIPFIEDKPFDLPRIGELVAESQAVGRYANFGPVSRRLEAELARIGGLAPGRVARVASSGTGALYAAIAAFQHEAGRPLRWVVSDYAFHCCFVGPLGAVAEVAPCDERGLLDMKSLAERSSDSYDGIVVTNPFGLHDDFDPVFEFALRHDKRVVFDNAAGFLAMRRFQSDPALAERPWAEVISLHQTKPWGIGEGGAAFLPERLAHAFERAIDFGQTLGEAAHPFCGNFKISELACAATLARAERGDAWRPRYVAQGQRVLGLGRKAGLSPLVAGFPEHVAPGCIAFLSTRPVPYEALADWEFAALKYYVPDVRSGAVARRIFEHVVNVPCHPGMEAVADDVLARRLRSIA